MIAIVVLNILLLSNSLYAMFHNCHNDRLTQISQRPCYAPIPQSQHFLLEQFELICNEYHYEIESSKQAVIDIKALLSKGLNPNAKTSSSQPLLIHLLDSMIHHKHLLKVMTAFIEKGASVNAKTAHGDSLLLHLCGKNFAKNKKKYAAAIAQLLIENGANINVQSKNGDTPLHLAIMKSNKELVEVLWNKNPKITCNHEGKDLFNLARESGEQDIIQLIQTHHISSVGDN